MAPLRTPAEGARMIDARRHATGTRGAVLIEALIVITTLVVLFVALIYVHRLYERELHVMRVSRAAGLAFATSGCQDAAGVTSALSPADARVIAPPHAGDAPAAGALLPDHRSTKVPEQPKAETALNETMKDTGFGLPRLATVEGQEDTGTVANSSGIGTRFHATVRSTTAVLCNERSKDGDIGGAVKHVMEFFKHESKPKATARGANPVAGGAGGDDDPPPPRRPGGPRQL